jgi:hypothetical protein
MTCGAIARHVLCSVPGDDVTLWNEHAGTTSDPGVGPLNAYQGYVKKQLASQV